MILYIPKKPMHLGFKLLCMVDSKTHYLYDMIIYPVKMHKDLVAPIMKESFTK